jgi:hypothetical protein
MRKPRWGIAPALLLTLVVPAAVALADNLKTNVADSTIVSDPAGGLHSVKLAGDGKTLFVDLDAAATTAYVYTFEFNTWVEPQGGNPPGYPLSVPFTARRHFGEDFSSRVKLLPKGDTPCASADYSGATQTTSATYAASGSATANNVVLCIQVQMPLSGEMTKGMNGVKLDGDTSGIAQLNGGRDVIIRFTKGAGSSALFWMSDANWIPQSEWAYTDAAGAPLGPNNFAIVASKTKVVSTNPGQFDSNFWLPSVSATALVMHVDVPSGFCLSADASGVSTKVYVGSSNINFSDPASQQEYKRNHSFTLNVGAVSGQDVYMTVHLNYCKSDTSGLLPYPTLNTYSFQGRADADGVLGNPAVYDLANASTTISGILKK